MKFDFLKNTEHWNRSNTSNSLSLKHILPDIPKTRKESALKLVHLKFFSAQSLTAHIVDIQKNKSTCMYYIVHVKVLGGFLE